MTKSISGTCRRTTFEPTPMKYNTSLTGSHLRTYNTIFQHPISRNLKWHDVYALFRHLGPVEEESNGNLKVTIKGKSLTLRPQNSKDVSEADEMMAIRHFIELLESTLEVSEEKGNHWLLVIDHHEARIFKSEMPGAYSQQILPPDPEEYFRHPHNSENVSRGKEKPDSNTYFEPVAAVLKAPGPILIFGTGTGRSSEMKQFISWLKTHHVDLAARIVGSVVVDEHHLTKGQLLAKAREFHAKAILAAV